MIAAVALEVLDQIDEGGFGPVEVVEHDDERSLSCQALEQRAGGEEDLLGVEVSADSPTAEARCLAFLPSTAPAGKSCLIMTFASSADSEWPIPAACRITSATGQKVMPSP